MVKRDLITNLVLVILLIGALIGLRLYVFEPYKVTRTDANDFIAQDQWVLALKTAKPAYRDLVLYQVDGKDYVGRVIAKPGDSVTYMADVLYLNNVSKEEPYLERFKNAYQKRLPGEYFTEDFTIESLTQTVDGVIPSKDYLILNDDRTNTADSRTFGLISKKQIKGVIYFRISPLSEIGFVDSY